MELFALIVHSSQRASTLITVRLEKGSIAQQLLELIEKECQ
jgi:hypothetical protein